MGRKEQILSLANMPGIVDIVLKVMPADWDKNGKAAGFIRNKAMHELIARYEHRGCVLFWDGKSKGTAHNFGLAEKYKTTIRIIRTDK